MPTTTSPPLSYAGINTAGLSQDYIFASEGIRLAMMEQNDPFDASFVRLVGDLDGSGSDTIRTVFVDDVGYARRASALPTETSAPVPAAITYGYDAVTGGFYGMADDTTLKSLVLGAPNRRLDLEDLVQLVPGTFSATRRYLVCVTGASISASVGSASTRAGVDEILDLVAAYEQTPGAIERGPLTLTLNPITHTHIRASARTEPAFQNSAVDFAATQNPRLGYEIPALLGLNLRAVITSDVQSSGGAYQNFATTRGAIGVVRARFSSVIPRLPVGVRSMAFSVDELGLIVYPRVGDMTSQVFGHNAIFVFGSGLADPTREFQYRLLDKTT